MSNAQSSDFESKYFLPKRTVYETVIAGIQNMAKASGLQERDSVYMEEPIEGASDLSLLNITASYEGSYDNLMRFLHEVDRCPMLLMLENLQAAPQQKSRTDQHVHSIPGDHPGRGERRGWGQPVSAASQTQDLRIASRSGSQGADWGAGAGRDLIVLVQLAE